MNNPDDQTNAAAAADPPPTLRWFIETSPATNPPTYQPHDSHRLNGLTTFVNNLKNVATPEERNRCIFDPCYAKRKFADWGGFYLEGDHPTWDALAIPASTVFRVYESDEKTVPPRPPRNRPKRDEQVIIVLENKEILDSTPTWRCTYSPYV